MIVRLMHKFTLLSLILFSTSVFPKDVLVFYVVNYPPYMIVNDDHEISGMDVEVVSAAFKEAGQLVEFKELPWKRIMKLMQIGEVVGALSCSQRKGRESYMLFSEYISLTRQAAITRGDMNTSNINTLDDLKNYTVTTVSGWGTSDQLTLHQVEHIASKDIRSGLVSVLLRGVDVLYGPEIPTMHQAKKLGEDIKVKATYLDDIPANKLHLCLSQRYPNSIGILDEFNRGLRIIKQNGQYKKIQAKYF